MALLRERIIKFENVSNQKPLNIENHCSISYSGLSVLDWVEFITNMSASSNSITKKSKLSLTQKSSAIVSAAINNIITNKALSPIVYFD